VRFALIVARAQAPRCAAGAGLRPAGGSQRQRAIDRAIEWAAPETDEAHQRSKGGAHGGTRGSPVLLRRGG
jgi:hypothetical protein